MSSIQLQLLNYDNAVNELLKVVENILETKNHWFSNKLLRLLNIQRNSLKLLLLTRD